MKQIEGVTLPAGWHWEEIGSHIDEFRTGIARGQKSRKEGYPHLRMNNISNELRLSLAELWRTPASDAELRDYALRDDDVLFNNTNSRDLVGKTCLFRRPSDQTFLFSNHITRIRTRHSLSPHYFVFWLNHLWRCGFFREKCDVWVNQAAARVEDLVFPTKLPLPATRDEQDRVALSFEQRVATFENVRLAAERQLEAIDAFELSLLRRSFDTPAAGDWKRTKLGDLAEIVMGQSPDGSTYNKTGNGLPLLNGPTEFGDDHPTPAQWTTNPTKRCQPDDLLLCVRGNTTGRMNRADRVYALGRGVAAVRGRAGKGHTRFIRHAIHYRLAKLLVGSERSIYPNIGKDDINAFGIFAPADPGEQERFAIELDAKLSHVRSLHVAAERQAEAIGALPAATLREFFNFGNGVHA